MPSQPAAPPCATLPAVGYVREPVLLQVVPFGRATLWREIEASRFPAPVKLAPRVNAWKVEQVRDWMAAR